METITLNLGGLTAANTAVEEMRLPLIRMADALPKAKFALDLVASSRRGIALVAPKGMGKTVAITLALTWFNDLERTKRNRDDSYKMRRALHLATVREASYRDFAIALMRTITRAYNGRVQGRKKTDKEIVSDLLEACAKRNFCILVIDEAEFLSPAALLVLRDIMAEAERNDAKRITADGTKSAGIGMLLVGDETVTHMLGETVEGGERWARIVSVQPPSLEEIATIYRAWFPMFEEHVAAVGERTWINYLASVLCPGSTVSFRMMENHARFYFSAVARRNPAVTTLADTPFDRQMFEHEAQQAAWATEKQEKREEGSRRWSTKKTKKGS